MRLHTDGSTIILLSPKGRLTWRESGKLTCEPPPKADVGDQYRRGMLCITPSGERDFSARLTAAGALAAEAIDEERVAAMICRDESTYLVRGPLPKDGDWSSVIDVGELEALQVAWPAGLIWKKGDKTLYDFAKKNGNGIPDGFPPTLECNQYGTALASSATGIVVVVRADSQAADFCLQVPSQDDTVLYGCPTKEGVLVTLVVDGQDSAYVHISEEGTVLAHRAAQSASPAVSLNEGFLISDAASGKFELLDASLTTLTSLSAPWTALDAASAPDGASFALADGEHLLRGHLNANKELVIVASHEYGNAGNRLPGEVAAAEAKWDPQRCHGKAAVGFAAGVSQAPWSAEAGAAFALTVHARSTGGVGQGIAIVIGGDAIKNCEFEAVEVLGQRTELGTDDKGDYVAELPNVDLMVGLAYPLDPKPKNDAQKHAAQLFLAETHVEMRLTGVAKGASGDLLAVSISALGSDSPPLKWMRPLTIS